MSKSPGLALLEKGFRTQTSCLWFQASCEESMPLLGLAVCRDSWWPPARSPAITEEQKLCAQQDWTNAPGSCLLQLSGQFSGPCPFI